MLEPTFTMLWLNTRLIHQERVDTLQTEHLTPYSNRVGFIIAYTYTRPMKYTGLEKLIFLFSTIWLLHWGVRLTQVGINALY
jgi:hypothetical protein